MSAPQAIHLTNTLPHPLLLGLGPILVLSVGRDFHSNIRWRRTTVSTQVWAPCAVQTAFFQTPVGPLLSPFVSAMLPSNNLAQLPLPTRRRAFTPFPS